MNKLLLALSLIICSLPTFAMKLSEAKKLIKIAVVSTCNLQERHYADDRSIKVMCGDSDMLTLAAIYHATSFFRAQAYYISDLDKLSKKVIKQYATPKDFFDHIK